ncbi:late secretory pathway protein avl9 [Myotisia sp. PD_48]|nr:late secretory pathway protein avl9 [Myotisia sp. PD_48]
MASRNPRQEPIVLVVDFHHARHVPSSYPYNRTARFAPPVAQHKHHTADNLGPEVEYWFCNDGVDPVKKNDWNLLPFMAMSDGAHADFTDVDILQKFWESLKISLSAEETELDEHLGLSLREMMLFFGSRCERLCMIQFSLISLIPGLLQNLQDCADPTYDTYAQTVTKPTSLKTSERSSLLAYMGLPLQIFGKGSMFGPYTPLQQLDLLADYGTKSYLVGSTNSLLLQQKDRYSDILINLDEDTVSISSPSLKSALSLSAADRRWIDFLTQTINETWDDAHPAQPKTHAYLGSEQFIRLQFEEYLLALLACAKFNDEMTRATETSPPISQTLDIEGDPSVDFNPEFLDRWRQTFNYSLFNKLTSDAMLYSVVEPRHPCAGGLGIEDIQRRLAQQVAELHLDEKVREGRETINKHLATGHQKVTTAFNNFWTEFEARRETQRKRNEERARKAAEEQQSNPIATDDKGNDTRESASLGSPRPSISSNRSTSSPVWTTSLAARKPPIDLSQAQASVSAASQKASAYFSSWGSWANDKRKDWQTKKAGSTAASDTNPNNGATSPRISMTMTMSSESSDTPTNPESEIKQVQPPATSPPSTPSATPIEAIPSPIPHKEEKGDIVSTPENLGSNEATTPVPSQSQQPT